MQGALAEEGSNAFPEGDAAGSTRNSPLSGSSARNMMPAKDAILEEEAMKASCRAEGTGTFDWEFQLEPWTRRGVARGFRRTMALSSRSVLYLYFPAVSWGRKTPSPAAVRGVVASAPFRGLPQPRLGLLALTSINLRER